MSKPTLADKMNVAIADEYFKAGFVAVNINPALVALLAMREPTEDMLMCADRMVVDGRFCDALMFEEVWGNMINAAISEELSKVLQAPGDAVTISGLTFRHA